LEKIGEAHHFPAAQQPHGHGIVVFAALGVDKGAMAVKIHNMQGIETAIVLDVPGAEKVGLVDVVDAQRFAEIGIFHPLGGIGSFF
jgi:hypothetical protein